MRTRTILPLTVALAFLGLFTNRAHAAVYQFAVPARDAGGREIKAFLWVPPDAERIRGVLVGGMTVIEPELAGDPRIRAACAAQQLAIVFFTPALDALFNYHDGNPGAALQAALTDLAKVSGYKEIAVAPLLPYGHSVSSIFASRVMQAEPERCFAGLPFKGALEPAPADRANALLGIPILAIKGQFEEFGPGPSGVLRSFEDRGAAWKSVRDTLLQLRAKDDHYLVSLLVEPGASHFTWSDNVAQYTASFIQKAAALRIPDWPIDSPAPPKLNAIDPASGALTSADFETPNEPAAAAYKEYKGDPKTAYWHPDLELAKAWEAIEADTQKKPQFVTFADPGSGAPISAEGDMRMNLPAKWVGPDTLKVAGVYLDQPPAKYPPVSGPVGHAAGPILFRTFAGPFEQTGPDTFRVGINGQESIRAEFLAYQPGDSIYRHAEQPARVRIPERLTDGQAQTITFQPIPALRVNSAPLELKATSTSGLPVRFYVESGPAVIEGNTLKVAEVPKRASFPIKITVVAYQYGSAIAPLVQSAPVVSQTVSLEK